jgi:uroporphyrinogen-III synthase
LNALRVLVTRPAEQTGEWVQRLRAEGIDALALPLIGIAPARDLAPLQAAWRTLAERALVMFVSPNAVAHFFAASSGAWPAATLAASPGPSTSAALSRAGVPEERLVEPAADAAQFDSEALWSRLCSRDWRGRRALVVRGDGGREWLADRLRAAGAQVDEVSAYRRTLPALDASQRRVLNEAIEQPREHLWWFASAQAIDHLAALTNDADWRTARALATHPRIAERARSLGFGAVETCSAAADAVLAAIRRSIQLRE